MTNLTPRQAETLASIFGAISLDQKRWQDEIGFGEEGDRLRQDFLRASGLGKLDPLYTFTEAALRNYYMVKLGLIMTEASEAFDEMRKHGVGERYYSTDEQGNSKPEGVLSELADIIIRIWSLMGETELSNELVLAIVEKLAYNETRARMHGGKAI